MAPNVGTARSGRTGLSGLTGLSGTANPIGLTGRSGTANPSGLTGPTGPAPPFGRRGRPPAPDGAARGGPERARPQPRASGTQMVRVMAGARRVSVSGG